MKTVRVYFQVGKHVSQQSFIIRNSIALSQKQ